MEGMTIGDASQRSGWSPRMLRYLERAGIGSPARSRGGHRLYGKRELELLARLADLRRRHKLALTDIAFALRLRREPFLNREFGRWLDELEAADLPATAWLDWEQRKHERLALNSAAA